MVARLVSWLGAAALLLLLSACGKDTLVVPVRVCVVQGATFAPVGASINMPAVTTQAHQIVTGASRILMSAADIGLLPYPDVRVIQDPTPSTSGRQQIGDVVQDLGLGGPSQESIDVIQACDTEWTRGSPTGKPPGVTLVFVRDFPSSNGGVNLDLLGFTPPLGTSQCATPYSVDPSFLRARWSIVKTHISATLTPAMWLDEVSHTTAHELAHLMMVGHGNGKDDDANGIWDEACDPAEFAKYDLVDPQAVNNLMHPSSLVGTSLSPLQRDLARAAAAQLAN